MEIQKTIFPLQKNQKQNNQHNIVYAKIAHISSCVYLRIHVFVVTNNNNYTRSTLLRIVDADDVEWFTPNHLGLYD